MKGKDGAYARGGIVKAKSASSPSKPAKLPSPKRVEITKSGVLKKYGNGGRVGDPIVGTKAPPRTGGTGAGLSDLSRASPPSPSSAASAPPPEKGIPLIPKWKEDKLGLAKGGAVPKAKGGKLFFGAPPSKTGRPRKYAQGGIVGFADGGAPGESVSLWERLKAGNIDDPNSEAYRRWGKGAAAAQPATLGAAPIGPDSATPPALPPGALAPTAPPLTPSAVASMPPPTEMAGSTPPSPAARPKPRKAKSVASQVSTKRAAPPRATPASASNLGPAIAAAGGSSAPGAGAGRGLPIGRGLDMPDLGPAIAAAGGPSARQRTPMPDLGPAIAAAGGPAPVPLRVGTEMGRASLPGLASSRGGQGGPAFGEAEMFGPTGAGAGRGGPPGGMPTAPPVQPGFGAKPGPEQLAMIREMRRRAGLPPEQFSKGGVVKQPKFVGQPVNKSMGRIAPGGKNPGPAVAAEHTKVPTFSPGKPKGLPGRLENDVAKPFGASHASPIASSSRGPVRKKFI